MLPMDSTGVAGALVGVQLADVYGRTMPNGSV